MKKHGKLLWFCRLVGAFVTAFIFLNVFCFLYSNAPIHYPAGNGATDFVWEPNKFYSSANEGFALGVTDKNGYNNSFPHQEGQGVDILIMGSSHMEAFEVPQDQSTTYQLNKRLRDGGSSDYAYNIGISSHDFIRCSANLEDALKGFRPTKYAVIETRSIIFTQSVIDAVLDGSFSKIPSYNGNLIGLLQRFPFIRLTYQQLGGFAGGALSQQLNPDLGSLGADMAKSTTPTPAYTDSFAKLIQKIADTAGRASVKLIIVYHPSVSFNSDGSMSLDANPDYLKLFKDDCGASGIRFVDMSEKFLSSYQTQSIVPYGFSNTAAGTGHLNRDGHRMVADVLYDIISKDEAEVKK